MYHQRARRPAHDFTLPRKSGPGLSSSFRKSKTSHSSLLGLDLSTTAGASTDRKEFTHNIRNNALCLFFICDKYFYHLYLVKIWVFFLLDFYNLILPFRKRISKNSAEQIRITRNSSLHWIVKRNTWMQHRPKMSSFSKRTRTFIKGKRYFPDYHSWKIYLIWFRVSGKSLFYENFSFKSDPNEFETRRRKTEERKLLRALVNDFTNTIV